MQVQNDYLIFGDYGGTWITVTLYLIHKSFREFEKWGLAKRRHSG